MIRTRQVNLRQVAAALLAPIGVVLSMTGCVTSGDSAPPASTVTIMTFNVENLFDTTHDPGKNDVTYLPLAEKQTDEHRAGCESISVAHWRDQCLNWDWNETVLEKKMRALASAILQVDDGRGPDILVVQEVENLSVLERLRTGYLSAARYRPAVLVEGTDKRGIDVAFLSRLPLAKEPVLHRIVFTGFEQSRVDDTRGILEATFRLPDGALLTGYAVHFPAPFHPYEMRVQAYEFLNGLRRGLPADRYAFAAGDFNTTAKEMQDHDVLRRLVAPLWSAVHENSCDGCKGTHYYAPNDSWSFLDMILWSGPVYTPRWHVVPGSTRLVNRGPGQMTDAGTPAAFRLPEASGVSDHWPLAVTIMKQAQP